MFQELRTSKIFFPMQLLPYFFGEWTRDKSFLASLVGKLFLFGYFLGVSLHEALETRRTGGHVVRKVRKTIFCWWICFSCPRYICIFRSGSARGRSREVKCVVSTNEKWWLSINLQRNRTRFISLKLVYSPNSRLVIHTVHLKYRRAKFWLSLNWILILNKNKEIREMICLSGNFCSHSFFFACNVKLEWRRILSFCEKTDHTHSIVSCYEKHCFWVRKSRVPTTKPSTITW